MVKVGSNTTVKVVKRKDAEQPAEWQLESIEMMFGRKPEVIEIPLLDSEQQRKKAEEFVEQGGVYVFMNAIPFLCGWMCYLIGKRGDGKAAVFFGEDDWEGIK